jgi:hypothetical protein
MKIAYLILAHNNPEQIIRTVKKINTNNVIFFINYDKKSLQTEYMQIKKELGCFRNVFFVKKRRKIYWGSFSMVLAILDLIKESLNSSENFDYAIFLSGQTYPIKSSDYIEDFLSQYKDEIFMSWKELDNNGPEINLLERIQKWWFYFNNKFYKFPKEPINIKRKFPKNFIPYKGSTWWVMPRKVLVYLNKFILDNKSFLNFFRYTFASDEMFFHTIILNSDYKKNVSKNNLLFQIWEGGSHPKTLITTDFLKIKESKALFARKFDINLDFNILDMIDEITPNHKKVQDYNNLNKTVSVIFGIKNRYDYRIVNALKSIKNQDYCQDLIEIILVDYGSKDIYFEEFSRLCNSFGVKGIWTKTRKVWNRSRCLNIGIKNSASDYILVADVDTIFEKNYISSCFDEILKNEKQAIYCRMLDTAEGDINSEINLDKYDLLKEKSIYRFDDNIYGVSIIFIKKSFIFDINGYDEFYQIWGKEDIDFAKRLEKIGINLIELSRKTSYLHQWHQKFEGVGQSRKFKKNLYKNNLYFWKNLSIIRNIDGWGEVIEEKNKDRIRRDIKKLPGSFWGVTSFFNPTRYGNKYKNYQIFREKSQKQGLKLITVEMAFGDDLFELKEGDADILVQLRTDKRNILWQKESLLNIGLSKLPKDCDKIAWLDSDVIFKNQNWVEETSKLLEEYVVVQPFSDVIRLQRGIKDIDNSIKFSRGTGNGQIVHSAAYGVAQINKGIISDLTWHGHTGFAWAARREVFNSDPFYDRMILGGGDQLIANAFYGKTNFRTNKNYPFKMILKEDQWLLRHYNLVKKSVYYTSGTLLHLWHGQQSSRHYSTRDSLLDIHSFNPDVDVEYDINNTLVWATDKPKLHRAVKKYFWLRNEDQSLFKRVIFINYKFILLVKSLKDIKRRKYLISIFKVRYNRYIGTIGKNIKNISPFLYKKLKKYFPDKKYYKKNINNYVNRQLKHSTYNFKKITKSGKKSIYRYIGRVGVFLSNYFPSIYKKLKPYFPNKE